MNLRTALNQAGPNSIADALRQLQFGEALALLLSTTASVESIAVTSNVATMAGTPTKIFQVNGSAGTHTGIKTIRRGAISGAGALIPASGQVIWDGATKLLFSSFDAITHTILTYAKAAPTDQTSLLLRSLTEPQEVDDVSIRDELNTADPNRLAPLLSLPQGGIGVGEAIALLLSALHTATPTESGVSVTSNVATLANAPSQLFVVKATTATTTGVKKLLIGRIVGDGAITPNTGECVWDGGTKVLFSAADVVSVASFLYATAAGDLVSVLMSDLGSN